MIITVKKIEMNANNDYQYSRIKKVGDDFASCTIEETRDELFFHFTNTDLICLEQGRKLKNIDKWKLLIQITEAVLKNEEYSFSICPENVCYDSLLRIKILVRDVVCQTANYNRVQQQIKIPSDTYQTARSCL